MAGRLVLSTLNNDTGVLATQNGMTGIAKAWVNFNGLTSPGTIRGSFNVGSVTKNGTGDYTVNFTTAMPDANFCVNTSSAINLPFISTTVSDQSNPIAFTTSSVRVQTGFYSTAGAQTLRDQAVVLVSVHSS